MSPLCFLMRDCVSEHPIRQTMKLAAPHRERLVCSVGIQTSSLPRTEPIISWHSHRTELLPTMAPKRKPDEPPEIQVFKHRLDLELQLSNNHLHYGDNSVSLPLILTSSNLTALPTFIQVLSNMLGRPEVATSSGLAHQGCCICPNDTISTILQATATTNHNHISVAQESSAVSYVSRKVILASC